MARTMKYSQFINESRQYGNFDATEAEKYFYNKTKVPDCIPSNAREWSEVNRQIAAMGEMMGRVRAGDMGAFKNIAYIDDGNARMEITKIITNNKYKKSIFEINRDVKGESMNELIFLGFPATIERDIKFIASNIVKNQEVEPDTLRFSNTHILDKKLDDCINDKIYDKKEGEYVPQKNKVFDVEANSYYDSKRKFLIPDVGNLTIYNDIGGIRLNCVVSMYIGNYNDYKIECKGLVIYGDEDDFSDAKNLNRLVKKLINPKQAIYLVGNLSGFADTDEELQEETTRIQKLLDKLKKKYNIVGTTIINDDADVSEECLELFEERIR